MPTEADILNIGLTKSAHFYKVKDGITFDASMWERVCEAIKNGIVKPSSNFVPTSWTEVLINGESVHYGLCVFRLRGTAPSFAKDINDFWTERKLGYFIVVEYNRYVAFQSRNITTPKCLLNAIVLLNYQVLTTLNNNSSYSKISMKNLEGGANAMRARTFIADDISKSMSAIGASHYMISSFNGKNTLGKTFAVTTSTSRIAERAQDLSIRDFCAWVYNTIINIKNNNVPTPTDFLSVFADYIDYKTEKHNNRLTPTSVLLATWALNDMLESAQCTISYEYKGITRNIQRADLMAYLEKQLNEPILLTARGEVFENAQKKIFVKLSNDKMLLLGERLRKVQISSQIEPDYNGTLIKFINKYSLFNVYFENASIIYTQDGLYKNHNLLQGYEQLLSIFETLNGMSVVTTEKHHGRSFAGLQSWADDSVFHVVESKYMNQFEYLICDDCEDEWADHIGIGDNKVVFFVEKCKDAQISASAFQEVVGQALKNLGNMMPLDVELDMKAIEWKRNHTTSSIPRWRNPQAGKSIDDAIAKWKSFRTNPYFEKEMCIVVNFIELQEFRDSLTNILNLNARTKAATIQRLWILSSFVNACLEVGVKPKILCK